MQPLGALAVALGCGLLIGLERERRKGQGPHRGAAGFRTFTVAALAGALAQISAQPLLVAAGALGVITLAALAYWRDRSRDPGLTTELALVATYLIGVQAAIAPALAAACAAVLAGVLAARDRLHRFATRVVTQQELHDGLLLAAIALVVVPLVPAQGPGWLAGLSPRALAVLVLLVLVIQAAGHVAHRLLGARAGMALSGFLGGFVSSTATVAAMGGVTRQQPQRLRAAAGAAVLSSAATWVQPVLMALPIAPAAAAALWPLCAAGAVVAALVALVLWPRGEALAMASPRASPLRVREALLVAGLLFAVAAGVTLARRALGDTGLYVGAAIAGLADAQAPLASVLALHPGEAADAQMLALTLALGVSTNTLTRTVVAAASGGARYAAVVGGGLALSLAAVWAVIAWRLGWIY